MNKHSANPAASPAIPYLAEAALSQLVEGVIIADQDGRIVFINEAAEKLHGVRLLGVAPHEYAASYKLLTLEGHAYPSADLPLARAVLHGETIREARWRIVRPDGTQVQVVGSAKPVLDADGGRAGAVLTMHDDEPRIRTENALREHEARLTALTDHLPGGMVYQIVTDADGSNRRFTYLSRSYEHLSGVSADAVLADAQVAYDMVHPDDKPMLAAAEEIAISQREPLDVEARCIRADGQVLWCRIISAPRFADDGSLIWDGIQIDITDQKRAEFAREESRRQLDAILGNMMTAVFLLNERQQCIYANAAAEALTGYAFKDMEGGILHDLVHGRRADGTSCSPGECPIHRALAGRAHVEGEELFVAPDATTYPVAFAASRLRDETGQPIGTVIEARNIVEQKAAAEARQQAEEAERLLTREVDHRAKNLLAVVQSLVKLTPFKDRTQYTSAIEGRIQALARVQSLLSRNRWTGAMLEELVQQELAAHIHNQPERLLVSGPHVAIRAELLQPLSMILHELATNAAKYGALSVPGGSVEVVWSVDTKLQLVWSERGGPPPTPPFAIGFGSKLVHGAARQVGGTVDFDWRPAGLCCTFETPTDHALVTTEPYDAKVDNANLSNTSLAGACILVVEDEVLIGLELERILTRAGASVIGPVMGYEEALEIARSAAYDCAVLDANLGGTSSDEVCRAVEARGLPFMILTGYEQLDFPEAWPVQRKPIREKDLTSLLGEVLAGGVKQRLYAFEASL